MKPDYKLIDHTADIGIEVFGSDAKELFTNAANALLDLITQFSPPKELKIQIIHVKGNDWPDLMVNWLRKILEMWSVDEIFAYPKNIIISPKHKITACLNLSYYDPDKHIIKEEIKAVTYHQIEVTEKEQGWQARVIFDI
ncbi:Archease [Candidatus Magnetomoraceae bacterium gMMP-15]